MSFGFCEPSDLVSCVCCRAVLRMYIELKYCSNETGFNSSSNTTIVRPAKLLKMNIKRAKPTGLMSELASNDGTQYLIAF